MIEGRGGFATVRSARIKNPLHFPSCDRLFIRLLIYSFVRSFIFSFAYSFICSFDHFSFVYSFVRYLIQPSLKSIIHPLIRHWELLELLSL